jgi:hypothetical protein
MGWPVVQVGGGGGYTFGWLSPLLADLTGDLRPEVIAVKERAVADPGRSEIYVFGPGGGAPLPGFPIQLEGLAYGMPTVCDLDDDGLADVLIGDLTRRLYRFELNLGFDPARDAVEWTRLQKDLGNTGRFPAADAGMVEELQGSPPALRITAFPNPFTDQVQFRLSGGLGEGGNGSTGFREWRIYDLGGRLVRVLSANAVGTRWAGDREDGTPAPAGLYVVQPMGDALRLKVLRLR